MLSRICSSPMRRVGAGFVTTGAVLSTLEAPDKLRLRSNSSMPTTLKICLIAPLTVLGALLSPVYVPQKVYKISRTQIGPFIESRLRSH